MNAIISISSSYGFDHNWTLIVSTKGGSKSFYLGQDVKFCSRVLGMETRDVVSAIGTSAISRGEIGNTKLADFICKELGINGRNFTKFEDWAFCCQ
jgi:hypothetical protein